jgi:hypothetical protein
MALFAVPNLPCPTSIRIANIIQALRGFAHEQDFRLTISVTDISWRVWANPNPRCR